MKPVDESAFWDQRNGLTIDSQRHDRILSFFLRPGIFLTKLHRKAGEKGRHPLKTPTNPVESPEMGGFQRWVLRGGGYLNNWGHACTGCNDIGSTFCESL